MNAYILRAKPHGKDKEPEFLEGRISIGWPCGEDLSGKDREVISSVLKNRYSDISAISVSMVKVFVDMKPGAIVLTPSLQKRSLVHLFRVTSAYQYDSSYESNGNPHFVEAQFLKTISRENLPKKVVHSLSGARKTLSKISQYFGVLDEFIESDFKTEEESNSSEANMSPAIKVLYELLDSEDEEVRLRAAITIVGLK